MSSFIVKEGICALLMSIQVQTIKQVMFVFLCYIVNVKLLRGAATNILMDDGFTVPTKEAQRCLEQARVFIKSLGTDVESLQKLHLNFADWVLSVLLKILMKASLEHLTQ